ncbi:MAG: helix-turn-helix transcriptional regulator [Saccharothrix sp.]|nr:helix-turn-helix transcriptional regulator [Saccharothrix sp.]
MSKDTRDFAEVLQAAIDKWYESAEDFARKSGGVVSNSSVSRWLARKSVPSARKIEQIAPLMHITPERLMAICYPSMAGGRTVTVMPDKPIHPLARELDRMIGDGSPLAEDTRDVIERLVDSVLAPYRKLLRSRKAV